MAATAGVRLLPLDQSLPAPLSQDGALSTARQRRRKTTRRAGAKNLARSEGGMELTSLESWSKTRTLEFTMETEENSVGIARSSHMDMVQGTYRSKKTQRLIFSFFSDSHTSRSELDSTVSIARQRRSRRKANKETLPSQSPRPPLTSQSPAAPGLEDSTDGVASILRKKLQQLELEGKDKRKDKKVMMTGLEEPPQASKDQNALISRTSDEGHSSDVGTQTDFEDEEEEEGEGGDRVKVKEG